MTVVYDNFNPVITGTFNGNSNQDAIWAGQGMPPGYLEDFDFSRAIFNSFEQINYNWMAMDMPGKAIFSSSQFGDGLIANNVEIYGAWGRTDLIINLAGNLDASGWQFKQGAYYNWVTGEDYVFINGTSGNQIVKGSSVSDTFVFKGIYADYSFSSNGAGGLVVTDKVSGRDGVDTISGVEFFKFLDVTKSISDINPTTQPQPTSQIFMSAPTNESFSGSGAQDKVVFDGNRGEYSVSRSGNTLTITDKIANRDGSDSLVGIETIDFKDGHLALDIPITADNSLVYRLYKAAFARVPDEAGDRYWVDVHSKGASFDSIASSFRNSPEFIQKYGASTTNSQFVDLLYQNVLGRAGEEGGVKYWNDVLNGGSANRDQVLISFAASQENVNNTAANINDGYWFT